MPDWRAIQCQAQREQLAHRGLKALGVKCWFPYRLQRRWQHGRRIRFKVGYFPGYVFADVEGVNTVEIAAVKGVERVLGERPIPRRVITELKARASPDGHVPDPPLRPGDQIALGLHSMVAELVALDERGKARVIIPLFGRWVFAFVPIPATLVEAPFPAPWRCVA